MIISGKCVGNDLWVVTMNGAAITKPVSYEEAYKVVWKIGQIVKRASA
jgi:hypothetical protein